MRFKKNCAEIVADRLIMDGVQINSPQYENRVREVWAQIYPDIPVPGIKLFNDSLWVSTRAIMESPSIRQVHLHKQQAFACERFIHFHLVRLYPDVRMEELRRSVEADMQKIGFGNFDDRNAMLAYTSRQDPEHADPGKMKISPKERSLIIAMYQWLISQYEKKAVELPSAVGPSEDPNRSNAVVEKPRCDTEKDVKPAASVNGAVDATPEKTEGRRRRSGQSRRRSAEELEARTLARIKGQLAIDLLLMNGEANVDADTDEDIEASERLQFIAACQACAELPDEYKDEQNLSKMWDVVSPQDKMLFTAGSMSDLLDSRFTVITCRCLLYAITSAEGASVHDKGAILAKAFELWEAFRLDSRPDAIRRLLKRNIERYYMVEDRIPDSVLALLRSKADDISDAYNMYLEQISEEQKQREVELNAKLVDQRKLDQLQQQVAQHANIVGLIKKFTALENGAALGWLCMAVHGADYSKEKLHYYIENLMQRLETVGLKPLAVEKVACVFDGGSEGTDVFVDMNGRPLEAGVKYQMAQLGWTYGEEIVVYPMAERV